MSLWGLYKFGWQLGLRTVPRRYGFRLLLEPCTYWRNVEVPETLTYLAARPGDRILDIGSPKLLSLFLAQQVGAEVWATDLYPYFFEEYHQHLLNLRLQGRYHIEVQDARSLPYSDNFFDRAYAISVLEHIEGDGDSKAMQEIARVLKPGGVLCLTLPISLSYAEFHTQANYYFTPHEQGATAFYERHYDPDALARRLVIPSGLRVLKQCFYGERLPFERFYDKRSKILKITLSPFAVFASKLLIYETGSFNRKAKTGLVLLQK